MTIRSVPRRVASGSACILAVLLLTGAQTVAPSEPILIGSALAGIGLVTIWFATVILGTRDQVRDMHAILCDPRTGVVASVDDHETRISTLERHVDGIRRAD